MKKKDIERNSERLFKKVKALALINEKLRDDLALAMWEPKGVGYFTYRDGKVVRIREVSGDFFDAFRLLSKKIHANMRASGWWEKERNDYELIALDHAELSEAVEGLRHGNGPSEHIPEFSAVEEEFADTIIRIMDHSAARGWDIAGAIKAKVEFNLTRPYRHGDKKA